MSMQDPISDMLTRLRNGQAAKKKLLLKCHLLSRKLLLQLF